MSLIVDISKWSQKTLKSWLMTLISVFVLACALYIILPYYFGRKTLNNNSLNSLNSSNSSKVKISEQIARQIEKTRLNLIFRTHADLAKVLKVPQQDIILNEVKTKTWTDTSLECLKPLQGPPLTTIPIRTSLNGWIITWKLGDIIYEYNTSVKGDWILCSKIEIPNNI